LETEPVAIDGRASPPYRRNATELERMAEKNLDLGRLLAPRRLRISCLDHPSESGCTLTLIGTEEELLPLAVWHAVTAHRHEDTPELREMMRAALRDTPRASEEED
jgi:hypothetical protein